MANGARSSVPKPRVVVGLDFGTTFSGFAYAHTADPEMIYTYYDYPKASGEKPYCKTLTASYYKQTDAGGWELKSWGYPARVDYERDIQAVRKQRGSSSATVGKYLSRYKLHLASKEMGVVSASPLPIPLEQVITDYLREMGALILKHIQDKYGAHFTKELIQWCVTVPSIWDNAGKATMKSAMIAAELLDASPHPLIIVLEPEAASFHCHKLIREQMLHVGDKLLVADVGGGTSDIVVQELVSVGDRYSVKEVTTSSGGLCGGTYIDARFMEFLHRKIGPCLPDCVANHPNLYAQLIRSWEYTKTNFGTHLCDSIDIDVPNRLATEWERYERQSGHPARQSYDEVEITYSEMQSIFDPVVEQNLELISSQLTQADELQILVVVGGFAESPYLLDAIRRRFATRVGHVISPPNPGSAVCQGAVALALNPGTLVSRVCKRTYGFENYDFFEKEVDPPEYLEVIDGVEYCINRFRVLARKGDKLKADDCFSEICCPRYGHGEKFVRFRLFSSEEPNPRYVVGGSVKPEGEFFMDVSGRMELGKDRKLKVSLFFGGSSLEVKAEAVNFWAQKVEIPVEVDYLLS
jgi:molecular chaperone DnaK (HSP70)